MPPKNPIAKQIPLLVATPQGAAIMTPPAIVECIISFILNLSLKSALMANVARQLPVNESIVLVMMRDRWKSLST